MKRHWDTYIAWYGLLLMWANVLLPLEDAKRAVRRTLAEMFIRALNGMETLDGPYMESVDVLYRCVCMQLPDQNSGFVGWAHRSMVYADEALLEAIAELYAATYECGYIARLSLSDRTEIAALIRLYDPRWQAIESLDETLEGNCPTTHPLRRVVEATKAEQPAAEHVQALALELATGETQRGTTWLKRQIIENGVR